MAEAETLERKNVVRDTSFRQRSDWVKDLIDEFCVVPTDDGGVFSVHRLEELCRENNLEVREYPNVGMARMSLGNKLRAAARRRHGLNANGRWRDADPGFVEGFDLTEDREGNKIKAAKPRE